MTAQTCAFVLHKIREGAISISSEFQDGAAVTPSKSPAFGKGAAVIFILGTAYMFNAMDRQVFPALLGPIRAQYGLTLAEGGFVSTIFTVCVAIFAALSGWFMARFGRKAVFLGGLVGYSVFTLATPLASGYFELATFRALTGVGEALQVGAVFACIGGYYGARCGAPMGAMQTFFGLGAFLGPFVGTWLESVFQSWAVSFYVYGIAGILVAAIALVSVPTTFTEAGQERTSERREQATRRGSSHALLRNVYLGSLSFGLVGLTFFSYTALYASFLHSARGFSMLEAGTLLGMYGLGAMAGVFGGWLGDKLGHAGMLGALAILGGCGFLLFHGPANALLQGALSLGVGMMVSGYLFSGFMSLIQRSSDPSRIGHTGSVALAAFYLPGPFAGYVFGKLVENYGWSIASTVMVAAPPALAILLMSFCNYSRIRQH